MEKGSPFACVMTNLKPEQRARTFELLDRLKAEKQEVAEIQNGFMFRYVTESGMLRDIAEFITYERLCCPFFDFELRVEREGGDTWLTLSGREGVKAFIREEFDLG